MKKRHFIIAAIIVMILVIAAFAQSPGEWIENPGNPIFGEGMGGPKAYYPSLLYDVDEFSGHGTSAKYKMWYGTSSSHTALAISDDGISWTNQGVVITDGYHATVKYFPGGFTGANKGDTKSSATMYYRMWYWDTDCLYDVSAIGYVESPDGVNWYNYQSCQNGIIAIVSGGDPSWNRGSYGPCDILYNPSASNTGTDWKFTMYYDGTTGGNESIGLGFSADGVTWTGYDSDSDNKADPVLTGSNVSGDWDYDYVSRATIIKNADDNYEMWYSGGSGKMNHGIGYATSSDGINWTRDSGNPIFHKTDGIAWRDDRSYCPSVIIIDDSYQMWFTGKSSVGGNYSIGMATFYPPPTEVWVDDDWTSQADVDVGLTWQYNAFSSLQDGINAVSSGTELERSIVHVYDGTYGISGQSSNAACQPSYPTAVLIKDLDYLTIQAVSGHEPVVKPVTGVEADIVSISIEHSNYLIIDNIDSDQTIAQFDNWHVCSSNNLTVRNCLFEGGEDGIDFNTDLTTALIENNIFRDIKTGSGDEVLDFTDGSYADLIIQDNTFLNNYRHITIHPPSGHEASDIIIRRNFMDGTTSQEGVRFNDGGGPVSKIILENNIIMNSRQQGLYVKPPVSDITVQHNTFFNNTEEEIRLREAAGDVILKNNIIYANGTHAAISARAPFLPGSLPGEDYNMIFNEGTSTESSSESPITIFGTSTITGLDPLFVSTTAGSEDLHLQDDSPAIAAGTDLGVTDDADKNARPLPDLTNPDIGAYESLQPKLPKDLKQDVRDDLASFLPTGDTKTDDKIEKALKHLNKSLDDEYWADPCHLTKEGKNVFDEEKHAVKDLEKLLKDEGDTASAVREAVEALVEIDATLAQILIDEAKAAAGEGEKEIEKAEDEMAKAQKSLDKDDFDRAIEHYKKAWEHAWKALDKSGGILPKQNVETETPSAAQLPDRFSLKQNYPNPFNPSTTIAYSIPNQSQVTLKIYNNVGKEVVTLYSGQSSAGNHLVTWNGKDASGNLVSGGIYFCRLHAGTHTRTIRMLLIK